MILADVPALDPNIQAEARLTDQFSRPMGNLPLQNVVSVLCHPY
jgi:hypothetical protein